MQHVLALERDDNFLVYRQVQVVDDVQVVRCQPIEGAGSLYQVGARFLWTMASGKGALRLALAESPMEAGLVVEGQNSLNE